MRSRYTNNWTPTVHWCWYILVPAATLLILTLGGVL